MGPIDLESFKRLPVEKVARFVRAAGPQVCVFPINGTRRWFAFEHPQAPDKDLIAAYMEWSSEAHISLYRLIFEHGIDTLVTPTLGSDILLRGEEYMARIGAEGLARLANGADFLAFYEKADVRVHFYGDHRKHLKDTPYSYLSDLFDKATEKTRHHGTRSLFFGVFAEDTAGSIAELSVTYFQKYGIIADRSSLIEQYYGEPISPATLFIGFGPFWVFDYPLLSSGTEDLYFMVAPSPYLNEGLLRSILYDHIYRRQSEEPEYSALPDSERVWLREFYRLNKDRAFGIGTLRSGVWVPDITIKHPEK